MTDLYYPLTPGYIDYYVYLMKGKWTEGNMFLDVIDPPVLSPVNAYQRCTRIVKGGLTAFVWGPGGVKCTAINPLATLYTGPSIDGIGERINNVHGGMVQTPGIMLLQAAHNIGTVVNGTSEVIDTDPATGEHSSFNFPWVNKTLSKGAWGPTWPDTIRTSLKELGGGQVYNYVFAKDIGIVNFWYGAAPGPDGVVNGYQFYASGWGI